MLSIYNISQDRRHIFFDIWYPLCLAFHRGKYYRNFELFNQLSSAMSWTVRLCFLRSFYYVQSKTCKREAKNTKDAFKKYSLKERLKIQKLT